MPCNRYVRFPVSKSDECSHKEKKKNSTFRGRQSSAMHHRITDPCIKLKPHHCKSSTVEAGASQQIGDLKTAYMTRTAPRNIFYSQIIGSFAGTLIATLVYKIYTSVKKIPNEEFGIPEAHMWLVAARLVYQQGLLPARALDFAIGAFLIGAVLSILTDFGVESLVERFRTIWCSNRHG